MNHVDTPSTTDPPQAPQTAAAARPLLVAHWRSALALVAAIVLAAAGIAGYQWRNGLHVFDAAGMAQISGIVGVGKTYYADANFGTSPHAGAVDLRSVTPHVISNTAHAHFQVMTCHKGSVNAVGAWTKPIFCADPPVAFRPGTHNFGDGSGTVTVLIRFTLPSPGRFNFNGIDVSYTAGWRHGAQSTGIFQHYRTPPPR